jgi:glycosyltransferase involved in cell wall biosynthesis
VLEDSTTTSGAANGARDGRRSERLPVSVIVPTFNRADTLARALSSVLAQRPTGPSEIIVVDDHSQDASAEIAARLGARVIRHDRNRGAAAARNTAVAAATQPWLATLDSDDEWLPDHLATLWALRAGHVLVAGASMSWFEESSRPPAYAGTVRPRRHTLRSPAALIPQNPIPASAVLVQREAVLAAGGYNVELRYAEDWDLWLRVLERGTGIITPRVVCIYHRHGGQKSEDRKGPAETHDRIVHSYVGRPWWSARLEQRWSGLQTWDSLEEALAQGRRSKAALLVTRMFIHPQQIFAVAQRRLRFWLSMQRSQRLAGPDAAATAAAGGSNSDVPSP